MILVFVAVFFLLPLVAVASMARGRTFARALGNSRGGFGRGRNLPQGSGRRISARQHVSSPMLLLAKPKTPPEGMMRVMLEVMWEITQEII